MCSLPRILDVPIIETERLRLRGHSMDDFAHCTALWGDAAVTQYIGGKPLTAEECWSRFLRYFGHWSLLGFGYWVVEERESGDFVGEAGFADYKREMEPPLEDAPELGWVLAPAKHRKGIRDRSRPCGDALGGEAFWREQRYMPNPPGSSSLDQSCHKVRIRRTPGRDVQR